MRFLRGRARAFALAMTLALIVGSIGTYAAPDPAGQGATQPSPIINGGGSPFGIVTHIATRYGIYGQQDKPMDLAAGTGAGWIREELRWDWVEHPIGKPDYGFTDEMVKDATGRGLNILAILGYNNSAQTAGQVNFSTPDIGLWKTYVANVVGRYKGQIHTWEVWNEPDVPYFWNGSVADYVALLKETYTTIKAVDPTATVLNGACSNLDMNWFNDFLNQGGAQYTDALAFHPYVMKSSLDNGNYTKIDLARFRDIQQKTGKSFWFTEIGWSSAASGADYGGGLGSEQAQSSYMVRQYVQTLAYPGLTVAHIFWYNFHNDGTDINNTENNFGLILNDWKTPKYSYVAYQRMAAHLTSAVPQGTVDPGMGTAATAYRFTRNGVTVDIAWGSGRTNLPTTATSAQAYDLTGKKLPTTVANGFVGVDLPAFGLPVYIEHSASPIGGDSRAANGPAPAAPAPAPGGGQSGGTQPGIIGVGQR